MELTTETYIRKPLFVEAVRVSAQNFDAIVEWCQGEVLTEEIPGQGITKKYIKVRVHNPKSPKQSKAFIGDWILYTERGYKVYTNKAFFASFDKAQETTNEVEFRSVGVMAENPNPQNGVHPIQSVTDTPQVQDTPTSPPQISDGKNVLSIKEQDVLSEDEIRERLQSGEYILEQDLV